MPPLLREASKQLRRTAGAEVSADVSGDELACLLDSSGPMSAGGSNWADEDAVSTSSSSPAGGSEAGSFSGDQRGLALLLTLCPPLALAAANPDNFLGALEVRRQSVGSTLGGWGVGGWGWGWGWGQDGMQPHAAAMSISRYSFG